MTTQNNRLQKYSAPALEKGLDILELLSMSGGKALNQSEIAKGIGRSKNEIFRMMVVLEERGYIRRGDEDVFFLTNKFRELQGSEFGSTQLIEAARPFMAHLSQQTNHSNHLWIVKDRKMRVIATATSAESYNLSLPEGTTSRIFGGSAGACFLSTLAGMEARLDYLRKLDEIVNEDAFGAFDKAVDECADTGVCILPSQQSQSIMEMSAPIIPQQNGNVIAALTIPLISTVERSNEIEAIAETLRNTVDAICSKISFWTFAAEQN